jgi:hypothetical protein
MRGFSSRVLKGEEKSTDQKPGENSFHDATEAGLMDESPVFDRTFYEKLIADILTREVSVDEAVELG